MNPLLTKIFGGAAGNIIKEIGATLDANITNKEERLAAEAKIKEVVFNYETRLQELLNESEKERLTDVANARSMNMKAMENGDSFVRRFQYYLAALYILATFGIYACLIFIDMSKTQETIIHMILGALIASTGTILQFFFGSTRGADAKNETIRNLSRP